MNTFSAEQIRSYERTILAFEEKRYNILLAQMQSGKTDTYHLIACEMLRLGKIKHIVIFSGNRERELYQQVKTKNRKEFYEKYEKYLEEKKIEKSILEKLDTCIQVIWGPQLKKEFGSLKHQDTFYIWEESHFAQTRGQHPAYVLENYGITMDGNLSWYEENNNYFLSVSATPFSEFVDNAEERKKGIVHLSAAVEYKSVKWYLSKELIKPYDDLEKGIMDALEYGETQRLGYGLIRITIRNLDKIMEIIQRKNWDYVLYDQQSTISNINSILDTSPEKHTIVLLKGKCRMGKQVSKQNVLFCFETSKYSKTDTLLQGLLGRCCGYHTNEKIWIYLYRYHLESRELFQFIQMYEKKDTTPYRGANLKTPKHFRPNKYGKFPTIPEKAIIQDTKKIVEEIKKLYEENSSLILSHNNPEQREEIKKQILDENTLFKVHQLSPSFKHYTIINPKLMESVEEKKPFTKQTIKENEIHLWIKEKECFVVINTIVVPSVVSPFPTTTKREIFFDKQKLEEEEMLEF